MSAMKLILQAFLLSAFLAGLSQGDECPSGPNQSPINLEASTATYDATKTMVINWQKTQDSTMIAVTNTGEALTVEATQGNHFQFSITIDDKQYDLQKFMYHWGGSEHAIEGEIMDGEVQFIFKNMEDESLAAVSMLLEEIEATEDEKSVLESTQWKEILSPLLEANAVFEREIESGTVEKETFTADEFFRYTGTLTAPPCSIAEIIVFSNPMPVSKAFLDGLKTLLTASVNRPLQTSTNTNPVYKSFP